MLPQSTQAANLYLVIYFDVGVYNYCHTFFQSNTDFAPAPSLQSQPAHKQEADVGSAQRSRNPSAASTRSQTHQPVATDSSSAPPPQGAATVYQTQTTQGGYQYQQQQTESAVVSGSSRTKHVSGSSHHSQSSKHDGKLYPDFVSSIFGKFIS